eukprot:CAMPEP_0115877948 /NCGR_PEP_ID=MMETSP0287-20121206/26502_1 /TAXON_ID=412157 /ORGANISM="Chrysochromulina rotalis, Strain UIO044" /LENGTH=147 /DNA_ID=CAMNT_0003333511 /DNA_START=448 /DNA_END=892 /DNA_ORIENTATION=+
MGPAWAVALEAASRRSFNGPRPSEAEGRYEEDWCHSMSSWKGAAASRLLAASSYMSVDMHDSVFRVVQRAAASEAEGRYEEDWCHSMSSWKGAAASRLLAASSYMSVDMHDIIEERPEEDIRHCCLRDALKPDVVGLLEIGVRITPD